MRQKIGLGQLRNSTAYYFDRVAEGESFDVIRRGQTVAQIVPLETTSGSDTSASDGTELPRMSASAHRGGDGSVGSKAAVSDLDVG